MTPERTEGPFFKANSPKRASLLESNTAGTKLVITGYVYTTDCQPVAHALLDFWQANANGAYDNSGYTLRGHQYTDANGRYQLTTIVPGLYTGRTEHIHVKVQAPNGPVLTTQLFFPGVAGNESDGIYDPKMVITVQDTPDATSAEYSPREWPATKSGSPWPSSLSASSAAGFTAAVDGRLNSTPTPSLP